MRLTVSVGSRARLTLLARWVAVVSMAASCSACGSGGASTTATPGPRTTTSPSSAVLPKTLPPRTEKWLGLNDNSAQRTGNLTDFSALGVVYDRGGRLEPDAGETLASTPRLAQGVRTSVLAGMTPDVEVDPATGPSGCAGDPNGSTRCLPVSLLDVDGYVNGFVATASSLLRAYPNRRFLFEPMNEPWDWAWPPGTPSGRMAAVEYAAMLARLLPAAKRAGIPLVDVYVPATGELNDGTFWVSDLYQAQPCLESGPHTCGPIAGWNIHPYGLPNSATEGIRTVPVDRALMLSGQDNIIISELGFCAQDIAGGTDCDHNRADITGTSAQSAARLRQALNEALAMHRAGWLRALLVWARAADGWGVQNADGSLTAQGEVLVQFASSHGSR